MQRKFHERIESDYIIYFSSPVEFPLFKHLDKRSFCPYITNVFCYWFFLSMPCMCFFIVKFVCALIAVEYFDGRWFEPIINIYDDPNIIDGKRKKNNNIRLGKKRRFSQSGRWFLSFFFFVLRVSNLCCHCAAFNMISAFWWIEHE